VLWFVTIVGFAYLFIPLITIVVVTFNNPGRTFNTEWKSSTWDNQGATRGFWTIVIAHGAFTISFVALTVKARIRGIDWSLEDAAADLGSPPLRTFITITFPLIVPGIIAAFLLSLSIDDYIITSFVAGDVSTRLRKIFDSSKVQILPPVRVLATVIMIVAILILVSGTVAGNRRRAKAG
jgi:spermidine/putrescine transport system permease protein